MKSRQVAATLLAACTCPPGSAKAVRCRTDGHPTALQLLGGNMQARNPAPSHRANTPERLPLLHGIVSAAALSHASTCTARRQEVAKRQSACMCKKYNWCLASAACTTCCRTTTNWSGCGQQQRHALHMRHPISNARHAPLGRQQATSQLYR